MECTLSNPFVPRASIIRYPNGIFEMRLHLHGVSSTVEVVPHENYVLVTGRLVPRARIDRFGYASSLVWSDQACGYFSRDIPVRLSPGTRIVILERRQDCDDLVIRYTLRNAYVPLSGCGQGAQFDAYSAQRGYATGGGCSSGFAGGVDGFQGGGGFSYAAGPGVPYMNTINGNVGHHGHGFDIGLGGHVHGDRAASCSCHVGPVNASFNGGVHYDVGGGIQAGFGNGAAAGPVPGMTTTTTTTGPGVQQII